MVKFNREHIDHFLSIVRKYMQLRGPYSQKDLAEMTSIGVSSLSRFLSQKTSELSHHIIGPIVAKLDIPFHEMVDFVEEESVEEFVKLVKFYKGNGEVSDFDRRKPIGGLSGTKEVGLTIREKLESLSPRQKAFLNDFLDLDIEGRDLVVDIGNNLLRYFKQKNLEL